MLDDYEVFVDDGPAVKVAEAPNDVLDAVESMLRGADGWRHTNGVPDPELVARGLERISIERLIRAKGWQ